MLRCTPSPPLFPYTTLFRSSPVRSSRREPCLDTSPPDPQLSALYQELSCGRSEEHTSELQSRVDIVCRLLLEKKNNIPKYEVAGEEDSGQQTKMTTYFTTKS